ncbi:MAG: hypothetical protein ACRENX_00210 [Candidatus Dormibacteria bacterium]
MNLFRKRSTIVLASVGAVGAIAAIATAASLALFYDPVSPTTASYAAGNVTLNKVSTSVCDFDNLAPDYSTRGYPGGRGDQSGVMPCTVKINYTGSLDAFLALDVEVQSFVGKNRTDCNGGDSGGLASCEPLYNPNAAANNEGQGLEVYVVGNAGNAAQQSFGIGNDQTISRPGTGSDVDTGYSTAATVGPPGSSPAKCVQEGDSQGADCPVRSGYEETFDVYVYWPIDNDGTQNVYQNSSASVTLTEHAVQAADNPLFSCNQIMDSQGTTDGTYENPDQPQSGWGAGFNAGSEQYPAIGACPKIDATQDGTDWTPTPPLLPTLLPFFHPDN